MLPTWFPRTCVDLCGNVRYAFAIVNRTGLQTMDPVEDTTKPPAPAKPKPKKRAKPKRKAKRPAKPKAKKTKAKKRKVVKSKPKKAATHKLNGDARSERLDMRLTKAQKAKIDAKAKKTRRTVTSLVIEAIEKIR
jgi:hypothetical protein